MVLTQNMDQIGISTLVEYCMYQICSRQSAALLTTLHATNLLPKAHLTSSQLALQQQAGGIKPT